MPTATVHTNGRAIRRYRILGGWNSIPFAQQAGISYSHLAHIEAGRKGGSPAVLNRIADALGRAIADIGTIDAA